MGKIKVEIETKYDIGDTVVFSKGDILNIGIIDGYHIGEDDRSIVWYNIRMNPQLVYSPSNLSDIAERNIIGKYEDLDLRDIRCYITKYTKDCRKDTTDKINAEIEAKYDIGDVVVFKDQNEFKAGIVEECIVDQNTHSLIWYDIRTSPDIVLYTLDENDIAFKLFDSAGSVKKYITQQQ